MAKTSVNPSRAPKSNSGFTAEKIALNAARQALAEYAQSPAQNEHVEAIVTKTLAIGVEPLVVATLDRLGIDTSDPKAMRKDMIHLRTWREIMDKLRDDGIGGIAKYIIISLGSLVVLGVSALIYRWH